MIISAVGTNRYVLYARDHPDDGEGRGELDSHADTTVAGANMVLLEETGVKVSVSAFSPQHKAIKDIPIGSCALAYDDENTGNTYILVFNEMMYFGNKMPQSLINPNQVRAQEHLVRDCPQQYDGELTHSIITSCGLEIPLHMMGVISYVPLRLPTDDKLE